MNTANNCHKLAQHYADNELLEEEKETFYSKMLIDGELKMEVELHQKMNSIIKDSSLENMKSILESAHQKYLKKNRSKRFGFFESKSVLAAASIIIGLLFTILFVSDDSNSISIFNEYYQAYELSSIKRNTKLLSEKEILWTKLIQTYISKDYKSVEALVANYSLKYELSPELELIEAITLIENKKFDLAEEKLRSLSKNKSHPFIIEALWYLSLLEILEGEVQSALALIDEIEKTSILNASMTNFKNELLEIQ